MSSESIPDVLADRYASDAMVRIWSPQAKIVCERELWIAVLRAQRELGLTIPSEAIEAYERVKDQVDLESIRRRERVTRHDVKARIDEFCALAGHEHIHKGLTSRDLTENVEQLQIKRGLELARRTYAACIARLAERVAEHRALAVTGRTHNVPAQVTTVGKRLAMFGTEMLCALRALDDLIERYPMRGLKGAVGTQLDLATLFGDAGRKAEALEERIAAELGFSRTLSAVGQVYPRELDFEVVAALYQLGAAPSGFAKTLRLMAGQDLATEGFEAGQVGSSAMPHKLNPRSSERINGLHVVLGGFVEMTMRLAGDQWNEGDVSCSVVRRVALPGAMFALDGILETFLTVVRRMRFFEPAIEAERMRFLPFLATTTILMESVKKGRGREQAHAAIKEHALAAAEAMRQGSGDGRDVLTRLAADARIGLSRPDLERILSENERFVGAALAQADAFLAAADGLRQRFPDAVGYEGRPIL